MRVCACVCVCVCVCVFVALYTHKSIMNLVLPGASSLLVQQREQRLVFSRASPPSQPSQLWYHTYLGMVKMEAFEDSHFMPQAVRGGHTDHTGSIVSLMACIFDLKKTLLCNWTLVLCRRAIALVW